MPPSGQDSAADPQAAAGQHQNNEGHQLLQKGVTLEGYEHGGIVQILRKDEVRFFRDIAEYYVAALIIIGCHLIYYFTGNIMIALFLGQAKIIMTHFIQGEETQDRKNLSKKSEKLFMNDYRFNYPMWACVALETLTWIWALCLFSDKVKFEGHYMQAVRPKTTAQYVLFGGVIGFLTSMTVSAGHELIHKRDSVNKTIGTLVFTKFGYSHFLEEHIQGHHKLMGTPEDGNTARKNESVYHFLLRECYTGHVSSWKREFKRIRKQYGENASFLTLILFNKMSFYLVIHASIFFSIYHFLGWQSLKYQLVYTFWGIYFLDGGNYIEHYGLVRKRDKNGIYESITKYHSWNHVGSPMYFKLQRHSDHHLASFRPYQILRRYDDAPWCPFQILSCFWTVLVPPLWKYSMNPRVDAIRDFQEGKKGNPTCWNNINSELTKHDKWIKQVIWVYVTTLTIIFGYLAFFTEVFNTF